MLKCCLFSLVDGLFSLVEWPIFEMFARSYRFEIFAKIRNPKISQGGLVQKCVMNLIMNLVVNLMVNLIVNLIENLVQTLAVNLVENLKLK